MEFTQENFDKLVAENKRLKAVEDQVPNLNIQLSKLAEYFKYEEFPDDQMLDASVEDGCFGDYDFPVYDFINGDKDYIVDFYIHSTRMMEDTTAPLHPAHIRYNRELEDQPDDPV